MGDGSLSPEDIDALLMGGGGGAPAAKGGATAADDPFAGLMGDSGSGSSSASDMSGFDGLAGLGAGSGGGNLDIFGGAGLGATSPSPSSSGGSSNAAGYFGPKPPNYDLLMNVELKITVELGRVKKYVKDILNLGEGSIIELDKTASDPVDLLISNKIIGHGEVVVSDENFGVRITKWNKFLQ